DLHPYLPLPEICWRKFRPHGARLAARPSCGTPQGEVKDWTVKARVFVTLKNGVLDPQGKAIGHALNGLGFSSVGEVRQGKVIDLDLAETDASKAKAELKQMCDKL